MYIKRTLLVSAFLLMVFVHARWTRMTSHLYTLSGEGHDGRFWMSTNSTNILPRLGMMGSNNSTKQETDATWRQLPHSSGNRSDSVKRTSWSSTEDEEEKQKNNAGIEQGATERSRLNGELFPGAALRDGKPITEESQIPELTMADAMRGKLMTIVSGYFEMPGMPHHPASYFHRSIPGTLRWLRRHSANVVYYHNLDLESHPLGKIFKESGVVLRKIELDQLPGANVSERFRQLCLRSERITVRGNKCKYLYERLRKFDSYPHVLSIWFSKLAFLNSLVRENPFNSVYFAWLDCGILSRLGPKVATKALRRDSVGTPRSVMRYGPENKGVGHRMGIMAGPGHKIQQLYRLHSQKVHKIFQEDVPMCYDEEIVLAELLRDEKLNSQAKNLVFYLK